ncbi:MAG: alpha/beta hydrolase [Candidatus Dormibacteria bacterium]
MGTAAEEIFTYPPLDGDLETFRVGDGERGVLLIHGFCGTPPEMRGLGEHLASQGFRAVGVLLAGHGTTPEDLERHGWRDWVASAEAELNVLQRDCREVFVTGQSMGGTMSLLLAARHPEIRAVSTLAALVSLGSRTEALIRLGRYIRRWHYPGRGAVDLWEPEQVKLLRSYNRRSMRSHVELLQLMRVTAREIAGMRVPTLVLHGQRDGVAPPNNARLIASLIGPAATMKLYPRSGHAMSVDVDREEVFEIITAHFRAAVVGQPSGQGATT